MYFSSTSPLPSLIQDEVKCVEDLVGDTYSISVLGSLEARRPFIVFDTAIALDS